MSQAENFSLYDRLRGAQECQLTVRLNQLQMDVDSSPPIEDFAEADYPGYSPQEFEFADPPQINPAKLFARVVSKRLEFTLEEELDPGQRIEGFYVTADFPDESKALVVWENFDGHQTLSNLGDRFEVKILLTAHQVPQA